MFAYITWQRNDKEILIVFFVMSGPEASEGYLPCLFHVNCVHPVTFGSTKHPYTYMEFRSSRNLGASPVS